MEKDLTEPHIGALSKVIGAAARPLIENIRHAIARHGYGRGDLLDVLTSEKPSMATASTLTLLYKLPHGLTQQKVDKVVASEAFLTITRLIVSAIISNTISLHRARLEWSLVGLLRVEYEGDHPDVLEPYANLLFEHVIKEATEFVDKLTTRLARPTDSFEWAYRNLALDHLSSIHALLESAVQDGGTTQSREERDHWIENYSRAFIAQHCTIDVPDLALRKRIDYKKLYVGSEFAPNNATAQHLAERFQRSRRDPLVLTDDELLSAAHRTVIIGDPGAGKSTTSSLLALHALTELGKIPLVLPLKHVRFESGGFSLVSEAIKRFDRVYQCPTSPQQVERFLHDGILFIVFDGLDELTDGRTRKDAVNVVDAICHRYPYVTVVVTSRRVGYQVARLAQSTFDEFVITKFGPERVSIYVDKWMRLQENIEPDEVDELVLDFERTSRSISDLTSNPLLLAFICVLYRGHRSIPRRRPELYRKCAELLLGEWDRARGITDEVPDTALYEVALARLAAEAIKAPDRTFSERDVFDVVLPTLLSESVPDKPTGKKLVRELLDLCRGRAWIFTDVGLNEYGEELFAFTHTSFVEYFAARYIDRTKESPEAVADELLPQLAAGRWEVLAQICLALRDRHTMAGSSRVVQRMLRYVEERTMLRSQQYRDEVMLASGTSPVGSGRTQLNEDVAITEFLLRTSDELSLSSPALESLVDFAITQLAEGRSRALAVIMEARYRYREVARDRLVSALNRCVSELAADSAGWDSPLLRSKAWISTHFSYITDLRGTDDISVEAVVEVAKQISPVVPDWTAIAARSPLAWRLALQVGNVGLSIYDNRGAPIVHASTAFTGLYESSGNSAMTFGPESIAVWIVRSLARRAYFPGDAVRAIRLLGEIGENAGPVFFELTVPVAPARYNDGKILEGVSRALIGHRKDVRVGWLMVVMGLVEVEERHEGQSRKAVIKRLGLERMFEYFNNLDLGHLTYLSDWLDGSVYIWGYDNTAVS